MTGLAAVSDQACSPTWECRSQVGRVGRAAAAPLRRYLDSRFDRLEAAIRRARRQFADGRAPKRSRRVDLTRAQHWKVASGVRAASFPKPSRLRSSPTRTFARLRRLLYPQSVILPWGASPGPMLHRKVWEFVYVLRAAEQYGVLTSGRHAVGFGVGREPIPAALAAHGVSVLATDLDASERESGAWAETGQHLSSLEALSVPGIVSDEVLERQVAIRYVDMNCDARRPRQLRPRMVVLRFEHLGSPRAGLEFVCERSSLLRPGGVSVHTTELELTARATTADYGNIVVYRPSDLDAFAREVRDRGFSIETNWYVAMETPADRWIAHHPYDDPAHLKLVIGDSVSTSVGLLIHRPA